MKLNYSFSKREIALILVLLLALVGLLYYRFVYMNISGQEEQYNTQDVEAQIQLEQMQLDKMQQMQSEITAAKGQTSTSSLETYDNQKAEINLLNDIFEPVIRYNFSFEKPVATGDTVRRNVKVSFTTIDYLSALEIIEKLYSSKYRVLVQDISIAPGDLTVDYLTALALEALTDSTTMAKLKRQFEILAKSGLEVPASVLDILTPKPETEVVDVPLTDAEGNALADIYGTPLTEKVLVTSTPETNPDDTLLMDADGRQVYDVVQEVLATPETAVVPDSEAEDGTVIPGGIVIVDSTSAESSDASAASGEGLSDEGIVVVNDSSAEGIPEDAGAASATPSETLPAETAADEVAAALPDGASLLAQLFGESETESESETETEKPLQTLENSLINVTMSLTFYETAYGAESLDGLIIEEAEAEEAAE